jgi:hypothetical protein
MLNKIKKGIIRVNKWKNRHIMLKYECKESPIMRKRNKYKMQTGLTTYYRDWNRNSLVLFLTK